MRRPNNQSLTRSPPHPLVSLAPPHSFAPSQSLFLTLAEPEYPRVSRSHAECRRTVACRLGINLVKLPARPGVSLTLSLARPVD